MLVRLSGLVLIGLGGAFWAGRALMLIPVHEQVGYVFVVSLWTLAVLTARAGAAPSLVGLTLVWGVAIPILGVKQDQLLVGNGHWVIQVLHLLVGAGAIGLAERLAASTGHVRTPASQPDKRRPGTA
jgi:hypothetical protein